MASSALQTMDAANRITINVGGIRHVVYKSTLRKIPATRLSRLSENTANYNPITQEYFFDRHPQIFAQILNYYRTGKLHYPLNVCGPLYEEELTYWGLDSNQVEPCCHMTYVRHRETQETLQALDRFDVDTERTAQDIAREFGWEDEYLRNRLTKWHKLKPQIWQLFNDPYSSTAAKVVAGFGIFFILVSVFSLVTRTLPDVRTVDLRNLTIVGWSSSSQEQQQQQQQQRVGGRKNSRAIAYKPPAVPFAIQNVTDVRDVRLEPPATDFVLDGTAAAAYSSAHQTEQSPYPYGNLSRPPSMEIFSQFSFLQKAWTVDQVNKVPLPVFNMLDYACNVWFTFEFIVRISTCPSKARFIRHPINLIDLTALLSFFNDFLIKRLLGDHSRYEILEIGNVLRILRLFKLTIHSAGLQILILTLQACWNKLSLLLFFVLLGMVLFGSLEYYAERLMINRKNDFGSIIDAMWWAIITLCTVGTGDLVPKTFPGKLVGSFCTVAGVLTIALPVPFFVSNFSLFYHHSQARSKLPKKRRRVVPVKQPGGGAAALTGGSGSQVAGRTRPSSVMRGNNSYNNHVAAAAGSATTTANNKNSSNSVGDDDDGIRAGVNRRTPMKNDIPSMHEQIKLNSVGHDSSSSTAVPQNLHAKSELL